MRKDFANLLFEEMKKNENIVLITADMGYGLWDNIRDTYKNRFFNVGSAEQVMIGAAAGIALEKKIPVCYSITPFLLYRPFEFIRNFLNHDRLPVKLVGGGRNRDYGYLGFTHWAEEDTNILDQLPNIKQFRPENVEKLIEEFPSFINDSGPCYINLIK